MIYTVTLNPAVDYVTHISKLETGNIMRSEKESVFFGGKGINVSTVLNSECCQLPWDFLQDLPARQSRTE